MERALLPKFRGRHRGSGRLSEGIPLNDPSGYVSDFFDVERATVRGTVSRSVSPTAFFGSGSSGGIINILTRDGGPEPISGDVYLVRDAYGLKKRWLRWGARPAS